MPPFRPLFVFGTLLDPDIRGRAIGPGWRRPGRPAVLPGHLARRVGGAEYPALRRWTAGRVAGRLLPRPDRSTLAALDRHEGDEYVRTSTTVFAGGRAVRAECYFAAAATPLGRTGWSLDARWRRRREGYIRRQFSPAASSRTIA